VSGVRPSVTLRYRVGIQIHTVECVNVNASSTWQSATVGVGGAVLPLVFIAFAREGGIAFGIFYLLVCTTVIDRKGLKMVFCCYYMNKFLVI